MDNTKPDANRTEHRTGADSIQRRRFLAGVGGLAAAVSVPPSAGQCSGGEHDLDRHGND